MQKPFFHAYALKPETLGATLRLRRKQLGYTLDRNGSRHRDQQENDYQN